MTMQYRDFALKLQDVASDGVFSGYGSVFGVKDSYDEIVAPGAFAESLAAHKIADTMPAMLWQHRSFEPIGAYLEMSEDSIGLKLTGQLELKTVRGAEAYALMNMKPRPALSGLSIGFVTREDSFDRVTGIRTLNTVELWEVSPVTFPANESARIQSVKSIETIPDLKTAEKILRDLGFSKRESLVFISKVVGLSRSDSDESEMTRCFNAIARRDSFFSTSDRRMK